MRPNESLTAYTRFVTFPRMPKCIGVNQIQLLCQVDMLREASTCLLTKEEADDDYSSCRQIAQHNRTACHELQDCRVGSVARQA